MELNLSQNTVLRSEIFDLLKTISYSKKDEFNNLIGSYSETLADDLDWWVGRPASRSTLQSSLFYHFCCLHLVNDLIKSDTNIEKVIVDSTALNRLLKTVRKKHGASFEIQRPKRRSPRFLYYFLRSVNDIIRAWKRKKSQFRAAKRTNHLSTFQNKKELILIDVFVFPGFITKDRYYNGLWNVLNLEQKKKTFFVPTLVMMKEDAFEAAYRKLRTTDRNFLIKEDYLTFSDLIFSLLHMFRVWFIKPQPQEVLGIDFSPLIREELLSGSGSDNALEGLLNYCFAKRLNEQSFNLSLVIDWWEGQPLDKGWNLGFNTFFPETPTKGYMGFPPIQLGLQLYPYKSEIKNRVVPDKISTIGRRFTNEIKAMNSTFEVETAPAFRFSHLWKNGIVSGQDSGIFKILIALSIKLDESVRIVDQVIDLRLDLEIDGIEFMIKAHPTMNIEKLKTRISKKWPDDFQEVEGSTPDYIRMADLLITGMSSIGLEAVILGVPTIVVETLVGFAYDPIPDSVPKELWRSCRSPEEISEAVNYFRNQNPEEVKKHQELSEKIKKDYFEPVTEEGVYTFLELEV